MGLDPPVEAVPLSADKDVQNGVGAHPLPNRLSSAYKSFVNDGKGSAECS
jgi:hypothetical protein